MNLHLKTIATSIVILSCVVILGCGQSGPERSAIQGKVTVAGTPLVSGRILFTPIAPTTGPVATAMIVNGVYQLPREQGPVVGKLRVTLEATPNLGFAIDDEQAYAAFVRSGARPAQDPIPPQFQQQPLEVEIVANQLNLFDVAVPKY